MPTVTEGELTFTFPDGWHVTQYDARAFTKRFANVCGGSKAVDFLAYDPQQMLWLIEVKDFRTQQRTKEKDLTLWEEVAHKVRDTLAGLFAAKVDKSHDEHADAVRTLRAKHLRVIFHLEQPRTHSKLFPRAFEPADVQQKLKQILKAIDPHPNVVALADMRAVPWDVHPNQ